MHSISSQQQRPVALNSTSNGISLNQEYELLQTLNSLITSQPISTEMASTWKRANFKNEQCQILKKIMKQDQDIMAVMPTGSGKSMLWIIPAITFAKCYTRPVVLIVLPTTALYAQTYHLCQKYNITCTTFNAYCDYNNIDGQIVIAAVEHVSMPKFHNLINMLEQENRLKLIVVDEAHLIIQWASFRPAMLQVAKLRQHKAPMLFMTATLPPIVEQELKHLTMSEFTVIRSKRVIRKELKYEVVSCVNKNNMLTMLCQWIEKHYPSTSWLHHNQSQAAASTLVKEPLISSFQSKHNQTHNQTQVHTGMVKNKTIVFFIVTFY